MFSWKCKIRPKIGSIRSSLIPCGEIVICGCMEGEEKRVEESRTSLGSALVHRTLHTLHHAEYPDTAVVKANAHEVRVLWVYVQAENATFGLKYVVGKRRVFERVKQKHARRLLRKII